MTWNSLTQWNLVDQVTSIGSKWLAKTIFAKKYQNLLIQTGYYGNLKNDS